MFVYALVRFPLGISMWEAIEQVLINFYKREKCYSSLLNDRKYDYILNVVI